MRFIHKFEVKADILLDRMRLEPYTNKLKSDYDNLKVIIKAEKNLNKY